MLIINIKFVSEMFYTLLCLACTLYLQHIPIHTSHISGINSHMRLVVIVSLNTEALHHTLQEIQARIRVLKVQDLLWLTGL